MKLLAGLNMLLLAGLLSLILLRDAMELYDAAYWWRSSKANEFEWATCETKRRSLVERVRKEGLWRRLGMDGQPWLK